MSKGKVIGGVHLGCVVYSDENDIFINLRMGYNLSIDKTNAKSVQIISNGKNKFMENRPSLRVMWYITVISSMLMGLSAMIVLDKFIFGATVLGVALVHFILSLAKPEILEAYQIEITWIDGEKSLIKCDGDMFDAIQGAFY